jgi:hypothetical protein
VSTSTFGRQPVSNLRLRESVDLHKGGRTSNRQAVFDSAKLSVNHLIALYRSQ